MANRHAVTASGENGTRSLTIRIPAEVARKCDINPGDVFWIEAEVNGTVIVRYTRTHRSGDENGRHGL